MHRLNVQLLLTLAITSFSGSLIAEPVMMTDVPDRRILLENFDTDNPGEWGGRIPLMSSSPGTDQGGPDQAYLPGGVGGYSNNLYLGSAEFGPAKSAFPGNPWSGAMMLAQADTGASAPTNPKIPDMGSSAKPAAEPQYTQAEINEMMNNPLGALWLLFVQNDTTWYDGDVLEFLGEGDKVFNTLTLQPVMPMQLTDNIKWIFRPVIPLHYWQAPTVSSGTPTQYPGAALVGFCGW